MTARVGLVLGAGGLAGLAYHAGTLAALADATGWDPATAEVVVGTSAGALAGSVLRAGVALAAVVERLASPAPAWRGTSGLAAPAGGRGSPALLLQAVRHPGSVRLGAAIAAALPHGAISADVIVESLRGVLTATWPSRATWLCAVNLENGSRVAFGAPGAPEAGWAEAVAASCAVPALFSPVVIGGTRYVDGGTHSMTNLDLLAGLGLDLAIAIAPMSARPVTRGPWLDRPFRAAGAARLAVEAAAVRRHGTPVLVVHPATADRHVMGLQLMDGRRGPAVMAQARASALAWLRRPETRRVLEPILTRF